MLVSIILPTYNRAHLLPRAIKSVLEQDYQDWELIIWDDGSTDNTKSIVQSFGDKRIKYFFDKNHGMSYALNQGIDKTIGENIAFLDDDDVWKESKLSLQVGMLTNFPEIDLVFGNFANCNHESGETRLAFSQNTDAIRPLTTKNIAEHEYLITGNFLKAIMLDNFIAFDTAMIRRSMLHKIGKFNEELRNAMDLEYWWRFGLLGGIPAYTETIVMVRNKYPHSLSGHNLITYQNHIKALDICTSEAIAAGQPELTDFLKPQYRNAWQNMITACAMENDKKGMVAAFKQSLKYGFRPGSLRLLIQGLLHTGGHR